jgi:hypothetical protein
MGGVTVCGGGGVTQPATSTAAKASDARTRVDMGWIFLEALVALALAVGIVWWTMKPAKRRVPEEDKAADRDGDDRAPR